MIDHLPTGGEPADFVVKGGETTGFASGMVRSSDAGKVDYAAPLDGPMFDRWAKHLTKGKVLYPDLPDGTPNWMQANSAAELRRYQKSAMRHLRQWLRGEVDEDHAAAVFFNINGAETVKERMAAERRAA